MAVKIQVSINDLLNPFNKKQDYSDTGMPF